MYKNNFKPIISKLLFLILFFWISAVSPVYGRTINTLSIVDRIEQRIMPELYHALKTAASNNPDRDISFKFTVFNPRKNDYMNLNPEFEENSIKVSNHIRNGVQDIISIKKALKNDKGIVEAFLKNIRSNSNSNLSKAYGYVELIMRGYDFLIIEPTYVTVVHPIFWDKNCKSISSMGADIEDIIDTAYAIMFLDVAIKTNKPVIGQCHGAQIGFLYAGGKLKKIFDIRKEKKLQPAIYGRKNPYGGPREIWSIDELLQDRYWNDPSIVELVKYPVPEYIKEYMGIKGKKVYLNKEIQQTLAMIKRPGDINTFTYHPLSANNIKDSYKFNHELAKKFPYLTKRANDNFQELILKEIIIDFYKYKTMIGTQYHPQITYADYDTKIFFDFIVKYIGEIIDKTSEQESIGD
ncbi:hypothetical protein GF312_06240 [Candidatus Poribacteria bacterium]|nr:hypothetical protein [Candidatus Poribacteria bacterium]